MRVCVDGCVHRWFTTSRRGGDGDGDGTSNKKAGTVLVVGKGDKKKKHGSLCIVWIPYWIEEGLGEGGAPETPGETQRREGV